MKPICGPTITDEMQQEFTRMFGHSPRKYIHPIFGFDVVDFDKQINKCQDELSCHDFLVKEYGEQAAKLVLRFIE